ncbi:MAG TPA: phage holin family protein [Candidatus Saccharimonadales bacterium]|nr:phage holin family protein [Candidatus Saccharimonadales bacterium]
MADSAPADSGLFASLRGLAGTFWAIVQNRVELFALEARAERTRLATILIGSVILLMTAFVCMLIIPALFLAAFWEERVWVLLAFSILYLAIMVVAALIIRRRTQEPIFGETITQLKKDQQWLMRRK